MKEFVELNTIKATNEFYNIHTQNVSDECKDTNREHWFLHCDYRFEHKVLWVASIVYSKN